MTFFDVQFRFPEGGYFLLLLIPLIVLVWSLFRFRRERIAPFAQTPVVIKRSRVNQWAKWSAFCLGAAFAVLAWMEPVGSGRYPDRPDQAGEGRVKAQDLFFLVDASASMKVEDVGTGQSRLGFAKEVADRVISRFRGQNMALYAFTSNTTVLSPLTLDSVFVRLMLRQMQVNEGDIAGTDLREAFSDLHESLAETERAKTVILLTDGGDTALEEEGAQRKRSIVSALQLPEEQPLQLIVVGIGSDKGGIVPDVTYKGSPVTSSLNAPFLKEVAREEGGRYISSLEGNALTLSRRISEWIREWETETEAVKGSGDFQYTHYFQIPLGLAVMLLIFFIYFPDTRTLKNGPLAVLLLFCFPGHAEGGGKDARDAYEAGMYAMAQKKYRDLSEEDLPPWKEQFIAYNLGTIYMAEGNWEQAKELFYQVSLPLPVLKKRASKNLALTLYRQAKEEDDPLMGIYYLRQSLELLSQLDKVRRAIKQKLATLLLQSPGEFSRENAVFLALSQLSRVKAKMESAPGRYREGAVKAARSWLPLWEKLDVDSYSEAVLQWQEGEDRKAMEAVAEAEKRLIALKAKIWDAMPLLEGLNHLIVFYDRASSEVPLQSVTLNGIALEQQETGKSIKLEKETDHLEKSLAALQRGETVKARIYLEEARFGVMRKRREVEQPAMEDPKEVLKVAIEEQQHALRLHLLVQLLEGMENLPVAAQRETVKSADPFLDVVYQQQLEEYRKRCQKYPWKQVIPLFEEGMAAARYAEEALRDRPERAAIAQRKAVAKWEKALKAFESPPPPEEKQEEIAEKEETKLNQVLIDLQKMELDDRKKGESRYYPQEGVKPW